MSRQGKLIATILLVIGFGFVFYWILSIPNRQAKVCKRNLAAVGKAIDQYVDAGAARKSGFDYPFHYMPAAYDADSQMSWRVAILPFLDQQELLDTYDPDQLWNSKHNRQLLPQRPNAYSCPLNSSKTKTAFQAVVGIQTMWQYERPVAIEYMPDGTSNMIMLVENHDAEVPWSAPHDMKWSQWKDKIPGSGHPRAGKKGTHVLLGDGTVRWLTAEADRKMWQKYLRVDDIAPKLRSRWTDERLIADMDGFSVHEFSDPIDAETLAATRMIPFASESIEDGENMIYCPMFALAWHQLSEITYSFAGSKLGTKLNVNAVRINASEVFPDSVVFSSGRTADQDANDAGEYQAKCTFEKALAFEWRFEAFDEPLIFRAEKGPISVRSFGLSQTFYRPGVEQQIFVLDYRSPDEFTIQIETLTGDQLFLSKMPKPETIADGLKKVDQYFKDSAEIVAARYYKTIASGKQKVVIPKLKINLLGDFAKELTSKSTSKQQLAATQTVQFRLDETGALQMSDEESYLHNYGQFYEDTKDRTFIFDKPFLVVLRRIHQQKQSPPYFAAWIANGEVMERVNKK